MGKLFWGYDPSQEQLFIPLVLVRRDDGGGIRIRHFGGYIVHCLCQGVINLLVLCIVYVFTWVSMQASG